MADSELLRARLCHTVRREDLWLGAEVYRATSVLAFPVEIRRPGSGGIAKGFAGQTVDCECCGAEVALVVYDVRRTAALRRRWFLLCLLGGLLCVFGLAGLVWPIGDISAGSALLGGLAAVIVVGAVLAIGFFRLWRAEFGVRCPPRSEGHFLWPSSVA